MTICVFDVGNVLIHWDARLVLRGVLPEPEIDPFLEEIDFVAWNLEQDRGRSWEEGVRLATAAHPRHADLIRRFHDDWHLAVPGAIDGTVEILRALHANGQPVYAITNFSAEKWAECCERFAFLTLFADTIVSGEERLIKPDPAIYRLLLERNDLDASECLFIDDSRVNVTGARNVGMDAVQFRCADALVRNLRDRRVRLR